MTTITLVSLSLTGITIIQQGEFYYLSTQGGDLKVKWDSFNTVYITLSKTPAEEITPLGLCGNANGNANVKGESDFLYLTCSVCVINQSIQL